MTHTPLKIQLSHQVCSFYASSLLTTLSTAVFINQFQNGTLDVFSQYEKPIERNHTRKRDAKPLDVGKHLTWPCVYFAYIGPNDICLNLNPLTVTVHLATSVHAHLWAGLTLTLQVFGM